MKDRLITIEERHRTVGITHSDYEWLVDEVSRLRVLSREAAEQPLSFFDTCAQWYQDAAKPVENLADDGEGGDPTKDYVISGDLAKDAADDLEKLLAPI